MSLIRFLDISLWQNRDKLSRIQLMNIGIFSDETVRPRQRVSETLEQLINFKHSLFSLINCISSLVKLTIQA